MSLASRASCLLRNLFRRDRVERDLDLEVRGYVDMLEADKVTTGMDRTEARREALLELGGVEQVKEQVREVRVGNLLENLWQDLRYGCRTLARNPGFTAVAVISLALGIGGNSAMFSIVNGVLLQPLPYPAPDRLVRVTGYYPKGALQVLQQDSHTMDVAGYVPGSEFNLTGQGEAMRLVGSTVSANLFSILGAQASIGRTFQPGEDVPGPDRRVILSHGLWQKKFGGDLAVIGRMITLDGVGREVVGVMPASFGFPSFEAQLWIPLRMDSRDAEDFWGKGFMPAIARLRPGATIAQAQNELRPLILRAIKRFSYTMAPTWNKDATVLTLQEDMVHDVRRMLLVLLCAVGFVLLIACANVASLLLSRSVARAKEIALRVSLGASRGRILRQLLTESVVLALAGGGLGLAFTFLFLTVLKSALPARTPRLSEAGVDWMSLGFVALLAILSGLISGLVPALSASRVNLAGTIKTGGQRSSGAAGVRLRSYLVAGEVALTVVLVVGAGLLIKSLWRLMQVNPGFQPERILTVRISPSQSFSKDRAACVALYDELLLRMRGISGVSEVAAVNAVPLSTDLPAVVVDLEGHPRNAAETMAPTPWAGAITPDYLRMMKIPLLAGRTFSQADGMKAPGVVLVSASTARRYWPDENPIGKHIKTVWETQWRTVVGVVADVRQYDLANNTPDWIKGTIYMPYPQAVDLTEEIPATMSLLFRTTADEGRVAQEVRQLVASVNPNVPVGEVRTMEAVVAGSTLQSRSIMWLFVAFAGSALILAAIGVYGVVSFSAAQRTYEIGVRVALGATRGSVFGMVLGQGLRLVLTGLAAGVGAALLLARMLTTLLYGVAATDPITFLAVSVLLIATAALAGYLPARRASRIDPLTALRVD
jgi:putative ABC transport system permease protein